jgi:outer membrane protein assembly factor BamB
MDGGTFVKCAGLACAYVCLLLATFLVVGCSGQAAEPAPTTPSTSSTAPAPSTTVTSNSSTGDDWPTYHRDLSRSGSDPAVSLGGSLRRLWTSEALDGDIYAEPLVFGERVLAATEHNSVYSLDITTGKVQWQVNLGTPVPSAELACGNIDSSGITGTPVADPATGRLYVVARLEPNHHELFVLDIEAGTILSHRTVDPTGADPRVQQQRAALALANGRVYVAFGGLYGDCGSYYGWLVSMPADGNGQLISYRVSSHRGASLWAPSGPAVDSAGNLYVTSGNGFSGSTFDYSNSVLRLSPDLTLADWFAPDNWQKLDSSDTDLGSMGPILLQGGLIFQAGKEGMGYLLRSDNLGHIGGEIYSGAIGHRAFGGAAYAPPYVFVPCTDGLAALRIDDTGTSFKVAWTGPGFFAGPPVVANGTVWTVDTGSGTLYGFTVDKGDVVIKVQLGKVMHFTTPALGRGNIFVAANRQIVSFGP